MSFINEIIFDEPGITIIYEGSGLKWADHFHIGVVGPSLSLEYSISSSSPLLISLNIMC